jgi:hypothetical protein
MQVLSVRRGVTKNLGNYQSAKLEIEAAPSDGQSAEQLLAEVRDSLSKQIDDVGVALGDEPAKSKPKAKAADSPLAEDKPAEPKKRGRKPKAEAGPDPTPKTSSTETAKAVSEATDEPFESDPKAHTKELQYALDASTLEEVHERLVDLRKYAGQFGDKWESAWRKVEDRAKALRSKNPTAADPDTVNALVAFFKSERDTANAATETVAA